MVNTNQLALMGGAFGGGAFVGGGGGGVMHMDDESDGTFRSLDDLAWVVSIL